MLHHGSEPHAPAPCNQGWVYRDQVSLALAGLTLIEYYAQRYRHSSREQWQQRIETGQILVDGQRAIASTPLRAGQRLTYHRPPWQEPDVPLTVEPVHEDEDILIIAKPSGLPVLPGGGFLEHTVLRQLQYQYPHDTPVPIHRLGRGTSGLLLLARSPLAKASLSQQMRDRVIRKMYRAVVDGATIPDRGVVDTPIGKCPHPVLGYVYGTTPDGLPAYSEWEVVQRSPASTVLSVLILTGRPHQIRIHLATVGYPLRGDPLYTVGGLPRLTAPAPGEKLPVPGDIGYYLHAYHLTFAHPRTAQPFTVEYHDSHFRIHHV